MSNNKPARYKTIKWFCKRRRAIIYGIDVFVNGEWFHVNNGKRAMLFEDRNQAIKKVKQLNKEVTNATTTEKY